MKVSKSLLQAIAVAVAVGVTAHACTKETVNPEGTNVKKKTPEFDCPACGMG